MGQAEIQNVLKKQSHRLISSVEIAFTLEQTTSVVTRALNQMLKYDEVFKIKVEGVFYWKLKNSPPICGHFVSR